MFDWLRKSLGSSTSKREQEPVSQPEFRPAKLPPRRDEKTQPPPPVWGLRAAPGALANQDKPTAKPAVLSQLPPVRQKAKLPDHFKKGDLIDGKYEILGIVGKGGFGVVYVAYVRDTNHVFALKTFRDELIASAEARDAFKKEALLWVNLGLHPFILAARFVFEVSGRLFVAMDFIAPDEKRRASLADHLALAAVPLDAVLTLKWAVQFCLGMEHAQAHGITSHRDIKPANILITQDGTLKITDFGLATGAEVALRKAGGESYSLTTGGPENGFSLSLTQAGAKKRCGTPGYMAPEVYRGEGADIRSDVYSFGLVLWQMASGSRIPPFATQYRGSLEDLMRETYEQQMTGCLPRVDEALDPVIERCLRPQPAERWRNFLEMREALEAILERVTGQKLEAPALGEDTASFWNNKGASLNYLGKHKEAIACLDQSLAIDPRQMNAWVNKSNTLVAFGRHQEAITCLDQALAIDSRFVAAWVNKGSVLDGLGRREEAIGCYDQALAIDPQVVAAWYSKGNTLGALGRRDEAIRCYDQALAIDSRYADAWCGKGVTFDSLGRREEAIRCYDQALAIDPRFILAFYNKGVALAAFGRREEAIRCYDQALAIDPNFAVAKNNKASLLVNSGTATRRGN